MPKVSVVVPIYNTEQYLEKCITSLVNQTLDDIEIILVNDSSTDNSYNIIKEYENKYPEKVKAFIKENGGLSDTRNFGIQKATGEFIGFVDSDDYVDINMFKEMYELAIKENLDMVEADFMWVYPTYTKKDISRKYCTFQDYFLYGRVMVCNKIFRRNIIVENDIFFSKGLNYEDIEFFYKFILHINKSGKIDKIFYYYNQRENSIINIQDDKNKDILKILEKLVNYYKKENVYEKYKSEIEYLYIRLLLGSSFLRILKIKDKKIKKELLNKNYKELNERFPQWRKNEILNKYKTKKNIYYKTVNKFTYKLYSIILK